MAMDYSRLPQGYEQAIEAIAIQRPWLTKQDIERQLMQESGGNPAAVSPAGARGVAQIMPETAAGMGIDPDDPWQALEGYTQYMDEGYAATGSNEGALAYYHGGPNRKLWGPKTRGYVEAIRGGGGGNQMPNRMAALMGLTPADQQMQLAGRLRRDSDFGNLAMMTGDPVLTGLGEQLLDRSHTSARQIGVGNREQQRIEMMRQNYENQAANRRLKLALEARKAQAEEEQDSADYNKLRKSDIDILTDIGSTLTTLEGARSQLDSEEFDPGQMDVPFARTGANLAAQYGIGTEGTKEVHDWWRAYNRFYTLPERNRLFGATLTPNEQAAWASANIGPEMDKEQIKRGLDELIRVYKQVITRIGSGYESEMYNPESIKKFMGRDYSGQTEDILIEITPEEGDSTVDWNDL